jgi:hypothetical protein
MENLLIHRASQRVLRKILPQQKVKKALEKVVLFP